MSYQAILSNDAARVIQTSDYVLQEAILAHLRKLEEAPTSVSRPSVLPFAPGYQMYQFSVVHETQRHLYTVLFKYGSNEQQLLVHGIGHIAYARDSDWPSS